MSTAVLLAGCATQQTDSALQAQETSLQAKTLAASSSSAASRPARISRGIQQTHAVIRVYFGTDRKPMSSSDPARAFGSQKAGGITYGNIDISIPREHRMGALERPSIWRLEFRPDPEKHLVLLSLNQQDKTQFFSEVLKRSRAGERPKAFVFIHGYNVSFEKAAKRTAQISYDLGFEGAPIFYSWPSHGTLPGYRNDEKTVEESEPLIKQFLSDIAHRLDKEEIYLIAHSMGNRPTTRALASLLTEKPGLRSRFKEIILMAPDIDAKVFKNEIAPRLVAPGQRITLYASSEDIALKGSKVLHKGQRLGDSSPQITVISGIESIDASNVDTSLLGHSYYADASSVLSDLFEVFRDKGAARSRSQLTRIPLSSGEFFRFRTQKLQTPRVADAD
ncbi:alpha/beta hydrolase [Formivibrio citricus]|uniref:alpha/beta hydrolase n=1 Tax=Formivibrio citricus TaxID=83765 RepID=UPI0015A6F82D|nr:alpha/beta hydrolase [Formivibrio citricus]